MTITLELPPETEAAVTREAEARGLPVPDYLLSLIEASATPELGRKQEAVEALRVMREDGDTDEQRETGEYLRRVLDEDRLSYRKLFP